MKHFGSWEELGAPLWSAVARPSYYPQIARPGPFHHALDIEIAVQGDKELPFYAEHKQAVGVYRDGVTVPNGERFKDDILRMLRNWKTSDQIKILANHYYGGFWWIVNKTRNEAVFVAQGQALSVDYNLWQRL